MIRPDDVPPSWRKEAWEYLCDNAPTHGVFHAVNLLAPFFKVKGYTDLSARDYAYACVNLWREEPAGGLVQVNRHAGYRFFGAEDDGKPKENTRRKPKAKRA